MAGIGSVAWPLGFLAILAAGYLLFFQLGLAPWFSAILVGAGLLMFVGLAITVSGTRDDRTPFQVGKAGRPATFDDDADNL